MENERRNLNLHDGSVGAGGLYNEVKINDSSKLNGDIDCTILRCSDSSEIEGNVKAVTAKISDDSKISGNINAEDTIVKDSSTIDGSIFSKKIRLYDSCKVNNSIKGEEIKINDSIEIKKDCECENFTGYDCFKIGGLLNAEEVNILLDDDCYVKEIGGNNISVSIPEHSKSISILNILHITINGIGYLTADTIEGNTIYLENTTAKVVRGNKITIGDNCKIDKIEYKENVNITGNSTINEKSKID